MQKLFGFLAFENVEELDLVGVWDMITMWRDYAGGPQACIIAEQAGKVRCRKGLQIYADHSFADCPRLDYLLIPGGSGAKVQAQMANTIAFVHLQAQRCQTILSVCTGALILQAAGLLKGKSIATHHLIAEEMQAADDQICVVAKRYVQDGAIWSSAGVSAGIDMALAFIATEAGVDTAGKVQYLAEYYPALEMYPAPGKLPHYVKGTMKIMENA